MAAAAARRRRRRWRRRRRHAPQSTTAPPAPPAAAAPPAPAVPATSPEAGAEAEAGDGDGNGDGDGGGGFDPTDGAAELDDDSDAAEADVRTAPQQQPPPRPRRRLCRSPALRLPRMRWRFRCPSHKGRGHSRRSCTRRRFRGSPAASSTRPARVLQLAALRSAARRRPWRSAQSHHRKSAVTGSAAPMAGHAQHAGAKSARSKGVRISSSPRGVLAAWRTRGKPRFFSARAPATAQGWRLGTRT